MISVIFTCKGRPALTELCLRRFTELMYLPHELFICYNGTNEHYMDKLQLLWSNHAKIIYGERRRFKLINEALEEAEGEYYMHFENDFYWVDPMCLDAALNAFHQYPDIDYIRFEYLPFTEKNFYKAEQVDEKDILWMKEDSPYRFTFNPHIRRFKFPSGNKFKEEGFSKQPEQHHNDGYQGVSCCMTGDNWRHLGVYDEGGHYKEYYADRFTNRRNTENFNPWAEFTWITDNPEYLDLFMRYLRDNGNKHSS